MDSIRKSETLPWIFNTYKSVESGDNKSLLGISEMRLEIITREMFNWPSLPSETFQYLTFSEILLILEITSLSCWLGVTVYTTINPAPSVE